jgi:quinol monooxygenase YgiN
MARGMAGAGSGCGVIIVTGTVLARADTFEEILRISTEHVVRSRAEPGCISHAVFRDTEDPLRLQFVERWADMGALKAHFAVPASGVFVAALGTLADEPPEMKLYDATEIGRG